MIKLNSIKEFEQAVTNSDLLMLLKHSSTCPISKAAFEEYEKFVQKQDNDAAAYFLIVQDARTLSKHISDEYQIKHESPQAILFSRNLAVWNTSHWNITENILTDVWQEKK